jgi:hypothetical protein
MTFTEKEIATFQEWETKQLHWQIDGGLYGNPPAKPDNYDLWKYGPELPPVEAVPCKGGKLVNVSWK